jgi:OmpA-OmpF porin, OOP family
MLLPCLNKLYQKSSTLLIATWGFFALGQSNQLNKISIEVNNGFTLKSDTNTLGSKVYLNLELAGRYMFNSIHGIKADVGVNPNKNDFNYTTFTKTFLTRYSLQYVLNLGRGLKFERYDPKISLLLHFGGGVSTQRYNQSKLFTSWKKNLADERINLIIGLTPQYNYSDRLELHANLSIVGNFYQAFNQGFKWSDLTKQSLYGNYFNFNLGLSYYIGKYDKHLDWMWKKKKIDVDILPPSKTETPPLVVDYDLDNDLIPDSIDVCPEIFGLKDFEGCPKPEIPIDCAVDNYPVFTFKAGKKNYLESYNSDLGKIVDCLNSFPLKKIIIYGHTDDHRNDFFVENLSLNRANEIKKQLVSRGIDENRIFTIGESSKQANLPDTIYQKIKHNRVAYLKSISNNKNDLKNLKTGEFVQNLVFTVQIGSFKKPIKNNKFAKYGDVFISNTEDGFTRYSINVYETYEEAYEKWKSLRNFGLFQDSFVSAYFLGEKITIKEAKVILSGKQ